MTAIVLVQAVLGAQSGIASDSVINDFCFIVPDPPGAVSESANLVMETAVKGFYNKTYSGTAVNNWLAAPLSRAAGKAQLRFYDITNNLTGTRHGSPYRTHLWQLGGVQSSSQLPSEVAIALSYRADYGSASEFGPGVGPKGGPLRPRARRRGRLYVGPLTATCQAQDAVTFRSYVGTPVRNTITAAAKDLMDLPDIEWAVWSRVDGNALKAVEAWCDDAFDTQRRRGERPVARTTVVAA